MSEQGYNGWVNFETWQAALWVNNDPGLVEWLDEQAAELVKDMPELEDYELAEELGEQIDEFLYTTITDVYGSLDGMMGDIVISWWSRVDWREIAEGYIAEAFDQWQKDNV